MKIQHLYKKSNFVLKTILIVLALGFLCQQIFFKKDLLMHFQHLYSSFSTEIFIPLFILAIGLMPINWLLEALKWRYLIKKNEDISILLSLKAIVAGISLSSITPNRVGEFFARLFVLKRTRFWEGVFITIIGSFSQTIVTLSLGLLAILFFWIKCPHCFQSFSNSMFYLIIYSVFTIIGILSLLIVYFKISWLSHLIPAKWKKIRLYSLVLQKYSTLELLKVLLFSLLRYLVFSSQFVFILWALKLDIPLSHCLLLVSIIFFINTINPSIALLEIGVRGSISLFVIKFYFEYFQKIDFNSEIEVLISSSIIWFINIVLPALVGLLYVKELNFFGFRNDPNDN